MSELKNNNLGDLEESDRRLVRLLCAGLSDEEIAERLGETSGAVGDRVARLLATIGAASRAQLVITAVLRGL